MSSHVDLLADVIADALTAEHLSYYGDRGSKTVKAYYRRVLYRAWGLTAHRGWARLMLDRRGLVQAPNAPRDQSQHPRARNEYELELELIQTQMAQKPMLRAEVYAHAMRASQNRKKGSVWRKSSYVLTSESGGRATHTVIELSFHLESNVALATRNEYDEETAYESYVNPEQGFQSGPGDSLDAD